MASHSLSSNAATLLIARFVLAVVPFFVLPAAVLALFYNYAALILTPQNSLRRHIRRSSRFKAQTIVITGVSSSAGLRAARAFYQTGHNVVGIETARSTFSSPARWSKAVGKLYRIRPSDDEHHFIEDLLDVVAKEKANLWIDCLDFHPVQVQAKHVIEKRTTCVCLTSNMDIADNFRTRYDFLDFAHSLRLPTLETHRVRSRSDIHAVLNDSKGKKYVLNGPNGTLTEAERKVFPRRTPSQTYQDVSQLQISKAKPWLLEQHIGGLQQYSTCCIVAEGKVRAFAAFTEVVGGVELLSATSGLALAMKQYISDLTARVGAGFSGHLSVDFCVDEKATQSGVVQQTLPVGGQLSAHVSLASFSGRKGSIDLTRAYFSIFASEINGIASFTGLPYDEQTDTVVSPSQTEGGVYQLDQIVFTFVVLPLVQLLTWQTSLREALRSWLTFVNRVFFWRDSVYEFWDPLPAVAVYLVYTRTNLRKWFQLLPTSPRGALRSTRT